MKLSASLERFRVGVGAWASPRHADYGSFLVPGPCATVLNIIASSPGEGDGGEDIPWEHVSVSTRKRPPNWTEMCFVKDLFWEPEVAVMQLHPPRSEWINNHPYCLHLWRPTKVEIPLPPSETVGIKELNLE